MELIVSDTYINIQWHACSLVVLQFNDCMCQGHTGCWTAGGYGLLGWRVQCSDFPSADFTCVQNKEGVRGPSPGKNFHFKVAETPFFLILSVQRVE